MFPGSKRLLRRFNGLVILNISGLTLGLASVIFIAIWVSHELSYDRYFKNADRIYRVESLLNFSGDPSVWKITPAPVAESFRKEFAEVEDAVVMQAGYNIAVKVDDNLFTAENLYFTDHSYFNVFAVNIIAGNPSELLEGPDEIVLSRKMAAVLFGNNDPIGKTILLNNAEMLTVTGVIENSPSNTHLKIDFLVPFSLLKKHGDDVESWGRIDFITYVLLKDQADPVKFNDKLAGFWQTKISNFAGTFFINPLTRLYLYRDPGFKSVKYPEGDKGPISRVIFFSVIGFILLLIACINFINLSTALASQRAKEIGVRKVNGASRNNLVLQLFGESLLQTTIATLAAISLAIILLPAFSKVSGVEFNTSNLFLPRNILIYIALTLFTGLISGTYPALVLSSYNPVKVIKPMPDSSMQGAGLRRILVIIQFALAIIFIFCILVINKQIAFMQSSDLGFDKDRVMVIYPQINADRMDVIADQIEKIPGVSKVALGGNVPVNMGNFSTFNRWDGNITGKPQMFYMMQVDDRYLDLLDIRISEGRQFFRGETGNEVIINEAAVKKMEMKEPLGKKIYQGDIGFTIIGVVKDFHFHNLKEEVQPVFIFKKTEWWAKRIFVKLEPGDHFKVVNNIIDVVKKNVPGFPPRYKFLDQETDKYFDGEKRLSTLMNGATILAIVISCIGLFSLTVFTVRKKRKEIGIRKAYGATIPIVWRMIQKDFGKLILVSSLIALPAGYYLISQWLSAYSKHISITAFYFLVTMFVIIAVSTLTTTLVAIRAASQNPAETLKNE